MTNEEAIVHLKERNENLVKVAKDENVYDYEKQVIEADCMRSSFEANEKAIQALEQQPCEDAISREEAIRVAEQGQIQGYEWQFKKLCNLPPVTPCPDWIPATQLPEPNTAVLLYVKYKSSGQWTYQLGMWNANKQSWEDWRTPYQLEEEFEIIKWMELPEGYEEDKHE